MTVTDVNETPSAIALSNSTVSENTDTSSGYSVGSLTTTDQDAGDSTTYSIVGGADAAVFSIGGAGSDELILTDGVLDFETQSSYEVIVRTTDSGGLTRDETFIIGVGDENEVPSIDSAAVTAATEDTVYTYNISTSDVDGDSLTINATTLPAWLGLVDNGDGTATLSGTPTNAEVGDHGVVIEVSDGSLTDTQSFTITVSDTNDVPVLDSVSLSVTEGQTVTLSGANFGITDLDDSSFTFNLTAITGGQFELTTAPGLSISSFSSAELAANEVVFVDNGDETAPSFDVTVNDGSANSNTLSASISYTPYNDGPVLESASLSVTEGQTITLSGANFGITDPDDSSFTYTLSSVSGGYFQLSSIPGVEIGSFNSADLSGNLVQFVDDGNETAPAFSVTVNDGTTGSATLTASIDYVPQNDSPVITSHSGSGNVSITLAENTANVTTVSAFDPEGDSLTYSMAGGADVGIFAIDASTGELVFSQLPDAENPEDVDQDNVYHAQIAVSDGNGGIDHLTFIIEVTDVDEFDVGLLMDMDETLDIISPLNSVNDQVGITVRAEDPDRDDDLITYSLDNDAGGMFTIDPGTGVIMLANEIPEMDVTDFEVTVRATSEDGSYSVRTFSITLYSMENVEEESEPGFLDEIIYDLAQIGEIEPDRAVTELNESGAEPVVMTVPVDSAEGIQQFEVSVGDFVQTVEPVPDLEVEARFDSGLSTQVGQVASESGYIKAKLTPVPVPVKYLPQFSTLSNDLIEVPETLWNLLDVMNQEMSRSHSEGGGGDGLTLKSAAFGTVALSAGYVAWLLRAGALSASLLSSAPLWRQVDPLPVLSARAKERESLAQEEASDDPREKRLSKLFDRSKKPGTAVQ